MYGHIQTRSSLRSKQMRDADKISLPGGWNRVFPENGFCWINAILPSYQQKAAFKLGAFPLVGEVRDFGCIDDKATFKVLRRPTGVVHIARGPGRAFKDLGLSNDDVLGGEGFGTKYAVPTLIVLVGMAGFNGFYGKSWAIGFLVVASVYFYLCRRWGKGSFAPEKTPEIIAEPIKEEPPKVAKKQMTYEEALVAKPSPQSYDVLFAHAVAMSGQKMSTRGDPDDEAELEFKNWADETDDESEVSEESEGRSGPEYGFDPGPDEVEAPLPALISRNASRDPVDIRPSNAAAGNSVANQDLLNAEMREREAEARAEAASADDASRTGAKKQRKGKHKNWQSTTFMLVLSSMFTVVSGSRISINRITREFDLDTDDAVKLATIHGDYMKCLNYDYGPKEICCSSKRTRAKIFDIDIDDDLLKKYINHICPPFEPDIDFELASRMPYAGGQSSDESGGEAVGFVIDDLSDQTRQVTSSLYNLAGDLLNNGKGMLSWFGRSAANVRDAVGDAVPDTAGKMAVDETVSMISKAKTKIKTLLLKVKEQLPDSDETASGTGRLMSKVIDRTLLLFGNVTWAMEDSGQTVWSELPSTMSAVNLTKATVSTSWDAVRWIGSLMSNTTGDVWYSDWTSFADNIVSGMPRMSRLAGQTAGGLLSGFAGEVGVTADRVTFLQPKVVKAYMEVFWDGTTIKEIRRMVRRDYTPWHDSIFSEEMRPLWFAIVLVTAVVMWHNTGAIREIFIAFANRPVVRER